MPSSEYHPAHPYSSASIPPCDPQPITTDILPPLTVPLPDIVNNIFKHHPPLKLIFSEQASLDPLTTLHEVNVLEAYHHLITRYTQTLDSKHPKLYQSLQAFFPAVLFHDLGKSFINPCIETASYIINKPPKVPNHSDPQTDRIDQRSPIEKAQFDLHSSIGSQAINYLINLFPHLDPNLIKNWATISLSHHESLNGKHPSSYPREQNPITDPITKLAIYFTQIADHLAAVGQPRAAYRDYRLSDQKIVSTLTSSLISPQTVSAVFYPLKAPELLHLQTFLLKTSFSALEVIQTKYPENLFRSQPAFTYQDQPLNSHQPQLPILSQTSEVLWQIHSPSYHQMLEQYLKKHLSLKITDH